MNEMESTPPQNNIRDIKNLESYSGGAGTQDGYNYTDNWGLDQLKPNKKKYKKYQMSD